MAKFAFWLNDNSATQDCKMHWKILYRKFAHEKNWIWFEGGPEFFPIPGPGQPLNGPASDRVLGANTRRNSS